MDPWVKMSCENLKNCSFILFIKFHFIYFFDFFWCFMLFKFFHSLIHKRNTRSTISETNFSAGNIGLTNCTPMNYGVVNYGLNTGSGLVFNYPYIINQPLLVNYYTRAPDQPQYPTIYYYLPTQSNLYQNQYVLINSEQQQSANGSFQVNNVNTTSISMPPNALPRERVDRAMYERYNISYNDNLWIQLSFNQMNCIYIFYIDCFEMKIINFVEIFTNVCYFSFNKMNWTKNFFSQIFLLMNPWLSVA